MSRSKISHERFYIYALCDPTKPVVDIVDDINFNFEPFYIGKGQGWRFKDHMRDWYLRSDPNLHKVRKINKIKKNKLNIINIIIYDNLTEVESFKLEKLFIRMIGRCDLKTGPLVNLTDGGDGVSGWKWTDERRDRQRILSSGQNNPGSSSNMTKEQRLDKAKKAAHTIKKYGLLKGENHPLYGKHRTRETRERIKNNHSDFNGLKNPNRKRWILSDPYGIIFDVIENKMKFCIDHDLRMDLLTKYIGHPIPLKFKNHGWCLLESKSF